MIPKRVKRFSEEIMPKHGKERCAMAVPRGCLTPSVAPSKTRNVLEKRPRKPPRKPE